VLDSEDLALAAEWGLWSGLAAQSPWPVQSLQALLGRCQRAGLELVCAPLQALVAWRGLQAGEAAGQGSAADEPALPPGQHGAVPWTALFAAQALELAGRHDEARDAAQAGLGWLHDTARSALSEAFRDAYLQRNPVHRALAVAAARLMR
jgi:hypothetical protein